MPHESITQKPRSQFRISLGGAMAAVFVLACMISAWHATRPSPIPTAAWLQWSDRTTNHHALTLTPQLLSAAKAGLIGRANTSDLAAGLFITSHSMNSMIKVERATWDPWDDSLIVDAVAAALVKAQHPATLKFVAHSKSYVRTPQEQDYTVRFLFAVGTGLATGLVLFSSRTLLARRSRSRLQTLLVAGAPHDPQR